MLKRFSRYPLIIDRTGRVTTFLVREFRNRMMMVTRFLEEAFLEVLESALRFGNLLLIQDVKYFDPILYTVLNREIRRTQGRVLIRLDFSLPVPRSSQRRTRPSSSLRIFKVVSHSKQLTESVTRPSERYPWSTRPY